MLPMQMPAKFIFLPTFLPIFTRIFTRRASAGHAQLHNRGHLRCQDTIIYTRVKAGLDPRVHPTWNVDLIPLVLLSQT